MKNKFYILLIFQIVSSYHVYGKSDLDIIDNILEIIDNPKSKIFHTNIELPKVIYDELSKLSEEDFKLANPKEPFNIGVRIDKKLPSRQLRFIINLGKSWLLCYTHGGSRASHTHILIIEANDKGEFYVQNFSAIEQIKNENKLKKYLKKGIIELSAGYEL